MENWAKFLLLVLLTFIPALLCSLIAPFLLISSDWYTVSGQNNHYQTKAVIGPYKAVLTLSCVNVSATCNYTNSVKTLTFSQLPSDVKSQGIVWTIGMFFAPLLILTTIASFCLLMFKWKDDPNFWRSFRFSLLIIVPGIPITVEFLIFIFIGLFGSTLRLTPSFSDNFNVTSSLLPSTSVNSFNMLWLMYILGIGCLITMISFALIKRIVRCSSYYKHAFSEDFTSLNDDPEGNKIYANGNVNTNAYQSASNGSYQPQPRGYQPQPGGYQPQPTSQQMDTGPQPAQKGY